MEANEGEDGDDKHLLFKRGVDGFPLWDSGLCCPRGVEKSLTLRQKIFLTFDDPGASVIARVVSSVVFFFIVVSTTAFILETLPEFHDSDSTIWLSIEVVSITVFTVEYMVRLVTCPHLIFFIFGVMNIIDLMAIVPFYIEIFMNYIVGSNVSLGLQFLRIMRVARVFRSMKISKYSSAMQLFGTAMKEAIGGLYLLLVYLGIAVIIFSSVMYYAERGTWDDEKRVWLRDDGTKSPYISIPAAFYWSMVTMTTVGYGDHVPVTTLGKSIAMLCMLMGILIIALPTSIIGSKFQQVLEDQRAGVPTDNFRTTMHTTMEWENQRREMEQYILTFEHMLKKIKQKSYMMDRLYIEQSTEKLKLEAELEELKINMLVTEGSPPTKGEEPEPEIDADVPARRELRRRASRSNERSPERMQRRPSNHKMNGVL